jgi:NAD-dependent dihydropyrimidine dehydrogenase PreA subunit
VSHILLSEHALPPSAGILGFAIHRRRFRGVALKGKPVTYIIAEPCVDVLDKACIEECPVDCIYEGNRMLYIHPDECVDCGACEPVCPVEAIFYEDDVPDQWKDYTNANYEFFEDLGSPGGASKVGKIDKDTPFVISQPPRGGDH